MSDVDIKTLLQQVFSLDIAEDNIHHSQLLSFPLQTVELGESIQCSDNQAILLLQGKIRVIKANGNGNGIGSSLTSLEPGAILDGQQISQLHIKLTVSSDAALFILAPSETIQAIPECTAPWRQTLSQIEKAKSKLAQKPASQETDKPLPTVSSQSPVHLTPSPQFETISVSDIISSIFSHYGMDAPAHLNTRSATTVDDLAQLLAPQGFIAQVKKMSWKKLLNADYPLLIQDEEQGFHWITGKKGNALVEEFRGTPRLFTPTQSMQQASYNTMVLRPVASKTNKNGPEAFSLAWYLNLLFQDGFLSIQMILMSLLAQIFALGMPVFYLIIFDRVFRHQNLSALDLMSLGLILILVFDILIKELRSYVLSHTLERADQISSDVLIDRVFSLPMTKGAQSKTRFSPEQLADLYKINQAYITMIVISSLDTLFSIFIVIVILLLHLKLALIALSPLLLIALFTFSSTPFQKKEALKTTQDQRKCQLRLAEVLENSETIKSLNVEYYFKHVVQKEVDAHILSKFPIRFFRSGSSYFINLFASVGTLGALYMGAHEVLAGEISYGIYLAITMLGRTVIGTIQKLFTSIVEFQDVQGNINQLRQLMNEENEYQRRGKGVVLTAPQGHIRMADVRFRYQSEMPWVLRDISLDVLPGEKVVVTGRSGSGKTTLIRLLQRLYIPNSGYITLDNVPLSEMDLSCLRRTVGVAVQKASIFSGTIRENILLGNTTATMEQVIEAASMVGLDFVMVHLPHGLDTELLPKGSNLSGGQVAQVALARIMLMNPNVLILDEADTAIDNYVKGDIYNRVLEKFRHRTCLFVTDYLPVHQKADRIIVLHQGQIVEQGNYDSLIRKQGYYYNLYYSYLADPIR